MGAVIQNLSYFRHDGGPIAPTNRVKNTVRMRVVDSFSIAGG
jgi:hypothetical protein